VAGSGEGKVRQDPPSARGLVNGRSVAVVVAVLVTVLALARCGGDVVALGRTDVANSDQVPLTAEAMTVRAVRASIGR
jgi:hypothetical protein